MFPGEKSPGLIEAAKSSTRPRPWRGFRGRNPPASLKHGRQDDAAGHAAPRPGFRGRNPPASLKLGCAPQQDAVGRAGFPGEKSPGLIEATAGPLARWRWRGCFRGRNPPASLKPGRVNRQGAFRDGGFRGRNPPASLKPPAVDRRLPCDGRRFRGRNPPASLKRSAISSSSSRRSAGFRGRNPPASLKPRVGELIGIPPTEFPGEKSPGLIEAAYSACRMHRESCRVSGGEIPRPH